MNLRNFLQGILTPSLASLKQFHACLYPSKTSLTTLFRVTLNLFQDSLTPIQATLNLLHFQASLTHAKAILTLYQDSRFSSSLPHFTRQKQPQYSCHITQGLTNSHTGLTPSTYATIHFLRPPLISTQATINLF